MLPLKDPKQHKCQFPEILSTFIKLPFVFKTFGLSIFEWPLKTGFTVHFDMASNLLEQWLPQLHEQIQ